MPEGGAKATGAGTLGPTGPGVAGWSRRNNSPVLMLSINGQPANDLLRITISFSHKRHLGKSAETKFVFRNDSRTLLEDPRLLPNTPWQYRYGFFNDLSPVVLGLIREVAPVYEAKDTVTVTLYDSLLTAATKSSAKNWGLVQSSDIATAIAQKYSFIPAVDPSNDIPKKCWIQPNNINDVRYLRDLAALIDFEVFVLGNPPTLYYRKKQYSAAPVAVLTVRDDPSEYSYVKSFRPKVKSLGPVQAGVASTDHEKGLGVKNATDDPSVVIGMPGLSGQNNLTGAPINQPYTYVAPTPPPKSDTSTPAPSQLDTKALSGIARQQMLDKCNEAHSEHPLTASIIPGCIYTWAGVEKQLSGKWYCVEEDSKITGTTSSTSCQWKRNAMGKGGEKLDNKNNTGTAPAAPAVQVQTSTASGDGAQLSVVR